MALSYADDFQQWVTAASPNNKQTGFINAAQAQAAADEIQSLGFFPPAGCLGTTGDASRFMTMAYDSTRKALRVSQYRKDVFHMLGASGLRRQFRYEGDTLYFGITLELSGSAQLPGDFLFFGNIEAPVFTATDCIGPMLYSVGVDTNGFYTFNGVSTTAQAYARPATVKAVLDCVFGPDYMELWLNNVQIARQTRTNIKLRDFAVSVQKMVDRESADFGIHIHSVIVADNVTPGFAQRVGRRTAKTEPVITAPTVESQVVTQGAQTAVQLLGRFASGPTTETDGQMYGNLSSPAFGTKNDFGSTRNAFRKPLAYAVMLQVKRFEPSSDGLSPLPYMTIAGNKVYGKMLVPTSTWKNTMYEIPAASGLDFSTFNFGYEQDYKDQNPVYVVDRSQTEVYG